MTMIGPCQLGNNSVHAVALQLHQSVDDGNEIKLSRRVQLVKRGF